MKLYDIVFVAASLTGLVALAWSKVAVEALISGIVIGGYIGWRVWHDAQ